MILPCFFVISTYDSRCWFSQKGRKCGLCCHAYSNNTGILTCFPFPYLLLGVRLGSINPWLIFIVKEPLPFRRMWFSHIFALTTARILYSSRSTYLFRHASARPECLPTTRFAAVSSIGNWFSPVHFQGHQPWQVSCYALIIGWLLLSQPPCCLRLMTPFAL